MRVLFCFLALAAVLLFPARVYPDQRREPVSSRHESGRVIEMECTAYTSSVEDCGKADGITATGTVAGPGTISADWSVLPPGTVIEVPGYGRGVVSDRGGAIRGNRLDVWLPSKEECVNYGRQRVKVRIIQ